MNNQELLKAACPIIGDLGASFYFIPETAAVGKELGMGGMEFYVLGRAGTMGNTTGTAVASAFGYFKPTFLAKVWGDAAAKCDPRKAGAAHLECCANLGRAKFASLPHLQEFVDALEAVNNATDPDGLALYAAMKGETLASDLPGRALQLIALLREFRGSAHLVALRAAGVPSMVAHSIKRPDMWKSFGYTEEEMPAADESVKKKMEEAERLTDAIVEPAFAVLSDAQRTTLVEGLQAAKAALKS